MLVDTWNTWKGWMNHFFLGVWFVSFMRDCLVLVSFCSGLLCALHFAQQNLLVTFVCTSKIWETGPRPG